PETFSPRFGGFTFIGFLGDMKRTHHCAELGVAHVGQTVTLAGWIDVVRDLVGILFIDLRDREGKTQVLLDPNNPALSEVQPSLKPESVIAVTGKVVRRDPSTINTTLATGEIEVVVEKVQIHN